MVTSPCSRPKVTPDAAEGIARAVVDFAARLLTEGHEAGADTLRRPEASGVVQALDAHPAATGTHLVRLPLSQPWSRTVARHWFMEACEVESAPPAPDGPNAAFREVR